MLAAEVDSIIPRAHSDAYAAAIAGAELRVAAECGHALYQERPGYVADLVIDFFSGTAR
ncbi:MAG TPA: hypothetical protein VGN22_05075 [Pseudonocardia sp.]